ncbi:hypothetical protein GLE_0959 [Lysobacter enzymogenes]|uniref:Uncharacterized protein n=1 Tax=Lysobacter enzymogenes TaxID=69 RepID=A0A0S2DD67_LYSEN|nr:hypothetical protein GLE_0959 [Lysobacter enzymogenes]
MRRRRVLRRFPRGRGRYEAPYRPDVGAMGRADPSSDAARRVGAPR